MYPDSMRASDSDRQRVVDALQDQTGLGRLTLQEFEQRSGEAYAATTLGDLRGLVADLPVGVLALGHATHPQPPVAEPHHPRSRTAPTARKQRTMTIAGVVLLVLVLAGFAASLATNGFFVPIPLLIVGFVLLRHYGGHGPGYHH